LYQIKTITNNFSVLSVEKLKSLFNNEANDIINYIDGWFCYSICLFDMKINKLNWNDRIDFLNKYLFIFILCGRSSNNSGT